jgi:hypothetical protein
MKIKFTINKKKLIIFLIILTMSILSIVYVSSLNNSKSYHKTSEITMDYSGNELAFEQNSNNLIIVDNAYQSEASYQSLYATGIVGRGLYWKDGMDIGDSGDVYKGLCFGSRDYPTNECTYFVQIINYPD